MTIQEPYHIIDNIQSGTAQIAFYKNKESKRPPKYTLAIFSGFGQTVQEYRLLNHIFTWGLQNKCRIAVVKTFINDLNLCTPKITKNYKYSDFQTLIDTCMEKISYATNGEKIHIVAHSTPTTPLTLHINNCIKSKQQPPVGSATFFAPYPIHSTILTSMARVAPDQNTRDKIQGMLPLANELFGAVKLIEPKIMARYNFPVCLIVGKKDSVAPAANVMQLVTDTANPNIQTTVVPENHNFSNLKDKDLGPFLFTILRIMSMSKNEK